MFTIKICGLTRLEDARWALEQGADYLGFVLYPASPRFVAAEALARIAGQLPDCARLVGVFVNAAPSLVKQVATECRLAAVQLNGNEAPMDYAALEVPVWRAVRLEQGQWRPSPDAWKAERFVLDAASPSFGGTGVKIDWDAGRVFAARHRAMLAGGLDPDSVEDAIRQVRPMGVDVSSGVESAPGIKDLHKVAAFIANARSTAGEGSV